MPPERPGRNRVEVKWPQAWRIIGSRYPPIHIFERVSSDPAAWEVLIELEQATNPRIRDEIGEIHLVPPERRVSGDGASYVMAPFTHPSPKGSRFSNGSYGVYYAAKEMETAVRETVYHFEQFARDSSDPPRQEDMRVLLGEISNSFDEVDSVLKDERVAILNSNSYASSQPFAASLREAGSNGISYPSVRKSGGRCIGAFWPNVVSIPIQERHLKYDWNGQSVARYFDFRLDSWVPLA